MRNVLLFVSVVSLSVLRGLALTPDQPMCELLAKPGMVPVTDASPEFSWCFKDALPADRQTAYQIQVATSTERFKTDHPDLWDTGRVASDCSINVSYAGQPLKPGTAAYWRVRVWDRKNGVGAWSYNCAFALADTLGADTALRYPLDQHQVKPVRIATNSVGHVFVDFGKDAFGWVEFVPPREMDKGDFILHIGEKANGDRVDTNPGGTIRYAKVRGALTSHSVYRVPFIADARNTGPAAVKLPKEQGVIMPFRYVEVEACPYPVTSDTIRQIVVNYPFDDTASSFACDDANLKRVYDLCKYSIKATSFAGVYVDGDRERIPYEADAYINQLCHYSVDREFTLARYSHEYLMAHPTWPTEWKQHSIMMAWTDWMYTGNTESLARCYDDLKKQKLLASCAREKDGLLVTGGPNAPTDTGLRDIVDWPAGERDGFDFKPVNAVINAFHCLNLRQMADLAAALGKTDEAADFTAKAERAAQAFQTVFFNSERGCYVDGEGSTHSSLHANMLPLAFGLVPEAERPRAAAFVRSRGMACSVYGAQYLLEALFLSGNETAAIDLMRRNDTRGWMNMLRAGSTITMEAWDMRFKPNSDWNHAWGAAPANIIPRYVLGVRPLTPGFGKILICPQSGDLDEIKGVVPTVRGPVSVEVRVEPSTSYALTVCVPANTTARIEVPASDAEGVWTLDGKRVEGAAANGRLVLDAVASGTHTVAWKTEAAARASDGTMGRLRSWCARALGWLPFF